MKPIIKVENLGKQYRIGARKEPYKTLRESLVLAAGSPFRRLRSAFRRSGRLPLKRSGDTIWALKDVSFEVKPGEVVGVIGRNGAGKSTLLKILSRITDPTRGQVDLYGRVGSLLEVGTGFHAELTGRENIYLSGAILGMKRAEINRKFDEIVSFAEIDQFIDTPVKHYSSGMYMRMAFSVAAHLEPEILLVDEVLAVGDIAFQKKCIGKMSEVAAQGRTVLFVSHNMGAISNLCTTGLVLENGEITCHKNASEAIDFYNHGMMNLNGKVSGKSPHVIYESSAEGNTSDFFISKIEILDQAGVPKPCVATWDDVVLRIHYYCKEYIQRGAVVLEIATVDRTRLLILSTEPDGTLPLVFKPGMQSVECVIEKIPFGSGEYIIGAGMGRPHIEWLWRQQELCRLTIVPRDVYGSGLPPSAPRSLVAISHTWRTVEEA